MDFTDAVEEVKFKLCEHPQTIVGYWLCVPFYLVFHILSSQMGNDPMGKYSYLTEAGRAAYD